MKRSQIYLKAALFLFDKLNTKNPYTYGVL